MLPTYRTIKEENYIFSSLENCGYVFSKIKLIEELNRTYMYGSKFNFYQDLLNYLTKDNGVYVNFEECVKRLKLEHVIFEISEWEFE